MDVTRQRLNKVLQINLMCLLLHLTLYGSTSELLLSLHNPFADFIVVCGVVSLIGLWLCFDFFTPVFCEAMRHRDGETLKPIGWMMIFTLAAFAGGAYNLTQIV
jgi:hypothetical protein